MKEKGIAAGTTMNIISESILNVFFTQDSISNEGGEKHSLIIAMGGKNEKLL